MISNKLINEYNRESGSWEAMRYGLPPPSKEPFNLRPKTKDRAFPFKGAIEMTTSAPKIDSLKSALDAIEATRNQLSTELSEIASKIQSAKSKIHSLEYGPISLDDYSQLLQRDIAHEAANFRKSWLGSRKEDHDTHKKMSWSEYKSGRASILRNVLRDGLTKDALCFFFPTVVHDELMAALREQESLLPKPLKWGNEDRPSISDRAQMLKSLEQEIAELVEQEASTRQELAQINQAVSGKTH